MRLVVALLAARVALSFLVSVARAQEPPQVPSNAPPSGGAPAPAGAPGGTPPPSGGGGMGVVVRLDATGEAVDAPVIVHLRPPTGPTVDVALRDDGASPDVAAGDGAWSAVATLGGDSFDVSMTVGTREVAGGPVAWAAGDSHRDLALTLASGALQATAGVAPEDPGAGSGGASASGVGPQGGDGTPGSPGGGDGTPGAPGGAAGARGAGQGGGAPEGAIGSTSNASLYLMFGVGSLALAGIAWMWFRGGGGGALPSGMTLVPEAPLVGPGTPSLSEGVSVWVVAPADARDFARAMLATLARTHKVVVAAPQRTAVAPVAGGPVYRVEAGKLRNVRVALDLLAGEGQGGAALLVLDEELDAAGLGRVGEVLPPGVGAVVLASALVSAGGPVVRVSREPGGWALSAGERTVRARESASGLDPEG